MGDTESQDNLFRERLMNLFSLIFILVGFHLAVPSFKTIFYSQFSRQWPEVAGKVFASDVEVKAPLVPVLFSETYLPRIWFSYEVKGQTHVSDNLYFGQGGVKERHRAEELVKKYQPGTKAAVFVHPDNHALSVMEKRDAALGICVTAGIGAIMIIFGTVAFFGAFARMKDEWNENDASN